MAIKRPDIYQHNNDKFAIVDSDYVRGGLRSVDNLSELYALYPNKDQLKQFVTQVYVKNLSQFYLLVDDTKINGSVFLPEAWKLIESSGSGLTNLILSLTWEELITLKNASELIPGVTYKITDYKFISPNARLTASTKHVDILVKATSALVSFSTLKILIVTLAISPSGISKVFNLTIVPAAGNTLPNNPVYDASIKISLLSYTTDMLYYKFLDFVLLGQYNLKNSYL